MIRAAVIGGSGYTGLELIRLLVRHPVVEMTAVCSRTHAGARLQDVFPAFSDFGTMRFAAELDHDCDVVFFAAPNGVAMQQVPQLLDAGRKVIDLSADFRFDDRSVWERWYQAEHACPQYLPEAVYGMPEIHRAAIRQARLVANPGCYPTAVLLGACPLLRTQAVRGSFLIADAKSGVSGAGRRQDIGLLFSETSDNFQAYKVMAHRHYPEIMAQLVACDTGRLLGTDFMFSFTPHLVPMNRGIFVTLYFATDCSQDALQKIFEDSYAGEPFVRVLPAGSHPQTRNTRMTNYCHIAVHRAPENRVAKVLVVLDNLIKGAAGQALQNMNLLFGQDETAGLQATAPLP